MGRAARGALGFVVVTGVTACSLLTDLRGFSSGDDEDAAQPERTAGETDGSSSDGAVPDGAAPDAGPYHPRYERTLTIDATAGATAADGSTLCLSLPSSDWAAIAAKAKADFSDVRVFGPTGERKRTVDVHASGIASVCFRLARAVAAGTKDDGYALRYGDPAANAPAAAERDVFDFFDGFDGAALDDRWMKAGAPSVGGGELRLGSGDNAITTSAGSDGIPTEASLEIRASVTKPDSDPMPTDAGTFFYWFGWQHTGDFVASEPWTVFIARGKGSVGAEHKTTSGPCRPGCGSSPAAQTTAMRTYRIDRTVAAVTFTSDDGVTYGAQGSNGDMSVMIRNFLLAGELHVDWVRARRIAPPEPEIAVGAEAPLP